MGKKNFLTFICNCDFITSLSLRFFYTLNFLHHVFYWTKPIFFLIVKIELLVDFEPKLKWDPIVILNNISWVHILLSEENNVVYSFAQIE